MLLCVSSAGCALLFSVVLLLLPVVVRTQSCELWAGDPAECAPHLENRSVYLFDGLNQTSTADLIRNLTANLLLIIANPLGTACGQKSMPFVCRNAFPLCVSVNDSTGSEVFVWQPQCRASCEAVNSECSAVFAFTNTSAVNCTATNAFVRSVPLYPIGNLSIPYQSEILQSPCESSASFQCPMTYLGIRLVRIPEDKQANFPITPGLPCWKCPFPSYFSEKQLHVSWYGQSVLGALSIVGTLVLLIPAAFDPKRRSYPGLIHVYLALTAHAVGWAYVMPGFVGYERTFCESSFLAADHTSGKCAVQAIVILGGGLALLMWTMALIFNVFWGVVLERQVRPWFHYWQLGMGFGYPAFMMVLVLALKQTYYNDTSGLLVITRGRALITWAIFYLPISISLLLQLTLIGLIVWKCFRHARDFRMARRLLMNQWRTFAYFIFIFYTYGIVLGLWIQYEVIRTDINKSVRDYTICLFNPLTGDSADCKPEHRLNVIAGIVLGWSTAITGVWVLLVFGITHDNVKWWSRLARRIYHQDFRDSGFSTPGTRSGNHGTPDPSTSAL